MKASKASAAGIVPKSYPLRGKSNALLTVSLFYEPWAATEEPLRAQGLKPIFTLTTDRAGYVSARKTFLELRDPTGVLWAEKWLEGVNHLNRLLQAPWFSEAFDIWVGECEQLLQAEALTKIKSIQDSESPASFQAAKYLASKEWQRRGRAGRPSKAEVSGELKRAMALVEAQNDDLARIQPKLKVVN